MSYESFYQFLLQTAYRMDLRPGFVEFFAFSRFIEVAINDFLLLSFVAHILIGTRDSKH